jgi:hypothetical protein
VESPSYFLLSTFLLSGGCKPSQKPSSLVLRLWHTVFPPLPASPPFEPIQFFLLLPACSAADLSPFISCRSLVTHSNPPLLTTNQRSSPEQNRKSKNTRSFALPTAKKSSTALLSSSHALFANLTLFRTTGSQLTAPRQLVSSSARLHLTTSDLRRFFPAAPPFAPFTDFNFISDLIQTLHDGFSTAKRSIA